jgi:hypothetical protein
MVVWPGYHFGDDVESELLIGWLAGGLGAVALGVLRWRFLPTRVAVLAGACSLVVGFILLNRVS